MASHLCVLLMIFGVVPSPGQPSVNLPAGDAKPTSGDASQTDVDSGIWLLANDIVAGGESADDAIRRFRALAPSLAHSNKLAASLYKIPEKERAKLLDLIVPVYEDKSHRGDFDNEYLTAVFLLRGSTLQPDTMALLEDIKRVPPYVFPDEDPSPWDSANAVHLYKGFPGQIALSIISLKTPEAKQQYSAALEGAKGDLRRTMIWALGHSTQIENFDYLMSLYEKSQGEERLWLAKSLNRIPFSIELEVEAGIVDHGKLAVAQGLKKRLEAKQAKVDLGFWD